MAKPKILCNVFAVLGEGSDTNRYNQFLAEWEGKYFITNPATVNNATIWKVVDRGYMDALWNQNKLVGGTREQQYQIISKLASYDALSTIRNSTTFGLASGYEFEVSPVSAFVSTPYAEPFTILQTGVVVSEVKTALGISLSGSGNGSGAAGGGSATGGAGTGTKSIVNTFNTMTDTTNGIFSGVGKAWDADPWGTALIGLGVVEGGTALVTGGKTMIVGKLWGGKTVLFSKGGGKKKKRS